MKSKSICFYLLITGVLAFLVGEVSKPKYVVTHTYSQFQVLIIAIGVAVTVLLILYVISILLARWLNKEKS